MATTLHRPKCHSAFHTGLGREVNDSRRNWHSNWVNTQDIQQLHTVRLSLTTTTEHQALAKWRNQISIPSISLGPIFLCTHCLSSDMLYFQNTRSSKHQHHRKRLYSRSSLASISPHQTDTRLHATKLHITVCQVTVSWMRRLTSWTLILITRGGNVMLPLTFL